MESHDQVVATFYKFVKLSDYAAWQQPLLRYCQAHQLKGTIVLAAEGINGSLAGSPERIDSLLACLRSDPRLKDLEHKQAWVNAPPFERMKVKLKKEIVPLGIPHIDPSLRSGTYVKPQDWNRLLSDPDVLLIDTRNEYEVTVGSFKGAHNPQIDSFREFPDYVRSHLDPGQHRRVALFCTGGIRCEKASAFMLEQGFEEVYQLQGGILKYLEEVPSQDSLWQGECFVFDQRVAVDQQLAVGSFLMCKACGHPVSVADQASPQYKLGISCPHCTSDPHPN
jgi:UPF0176 protein